MEVDHKRYLNISENLILVFKGGLLGCPSEAETTTTTAAPPTTTTKCGGLLGGGLLC